MTAQVHEVLILDGIKTSIAFCPPLPKDNKRLIELRGDQGISTACWRGYQGSWEIKDGKFFLTGIRGKHQLSDGAPIFASWFTGTIKVPKGDILRYVHGGFTTVYEQEINIVIQNGFVTATTTTDNRPSPPKATNIEYGVVSKYFSDRGFGFVRGLLLRNNSEVFFHIKTIKKTAPQLAESLARDSFEEKLYFWFDTETTSKGIQVRAVLSSEQLRQGAVFDSSRLIERVESYWRNLDHQTPSWLDSATSDLIGRDRTDKLSLERRSLETQKKKKRELERKQLEAQAVIEQEKRQRQRDDERAQEQLEEDEFQNLVAEMMKFGFTHSSQVSNYIVSNRLGYKYKNISGILQMELDGTTWNFKGGFPPKIYARLCDELGLSNNGTRARAVAFESFGNIEERSSRK